MEPCKKREVGELKSWEESGCVKEGRKERGRVKLWCIYAATSQAGKSVLSVGCSVKDNIRRGEDSRVLGVHS